VLDIPLASSLGVMTLMSVKGVGGVTVEKAIARFATLGEVHAASPEACKGALNAAVAATLRDRAVLDAAWDAARRESDTAAAEGVALLTPFDAAYPERLRDAPDRPLVLYAAGDISTLDRSVACVGTRDPTPFGDIACRRIGAALAEAGWCIVSGLARGIDHAAHETALACGAPTVAVVASGLDAMGSERQRDLARRILDGGGALLSEQPFGREADSGTLVRRNRIQSGVSVATFVMQSRRDGGTMQTARYALTQGRPIYAPVPPGRHATEEASEGLLLLLEGDGPALAAAIGAGKAFTQLATENWSGRPVASPVAGRDDYPRVLSEIEDLLQPPARPSP